MPRGWSTRVPARPRCAQRRGPSLIYAERPPAGEVRCAQPKSGCSQGAGLARTVDARKARALSGLMARPAPPTTPPAVPNGLPSSSRNNFFPKPSFAVEPARALSGLMARPAPRTTPPVVPNGLPLRPQNNFSQNRLLLAAWYLSAGVAVLYIQWEVRGVALGRELDAGALAVGGHVVGELAVEAQEVAQDGCRDSFGFVLTRDSAWA